MKKLWIPLLATLVVAIDGMAASISYNRDIRPLLSDKCFYCHGPDPDHRKAKLRIDNSEGATRDLGGYRAIVPGKPNESELISRIFTDDQDDLMPPPDSEKSLTSAEKDLLRRWVAEGAEYQAHWSFELPKRANLPAVNHDLPGFVVMVSRGTGRPNCQPLYDRLWGAAMLPSKHQGVKFLSTGDPVLYLSNPKGIDRATRRRQLDELATLNRHRQAQIGDPEISARIAQYEMAYRMQMSVPELTDTRDEPQHVLDMYGPDMNKRGTCANSCLLARSLAERDVRFIKLYHMGWDQHFTLPKQISGQCKDTDQPTAALLRDLKQRGLLDDTLVIWSGEFGRTVYCQGKLTRENYGRDHHPRCFTTWLAGGGIKPGISYGVTDDFSYNIVENPVHVNELNATILAALGIDHKSLTVKFQGLDLRLTGVEGHDVVRDLLKTAS